MSDTIIMLTYSGYFLGCLRPCLTRVRSAKTIFIKSVFAKNTFIEDVFENIFVNIRLFGVSYWLSIKWSFINVLQNLVKLYNI